MNTVQGHLHEGLPDKEVALCIHLCQGGIGKLMGEEAAALSLSVYSSAPEQNSATCTCPAHTLAAAST